MDWVNRDVASRVDWRALNSQTGVDRDGGPSYRHADRPVVFDEFQTLWQTAFRPSSWDPHAALITDAVANEIGARSHDGRRVAYPVYDVGALELLFGPVEREGARRARGIAFAAVPLTQTSALAIPVRVDSVEIDGKVYEAGRTAILPVVDRDGTSIVQFIEIALDEAAGASGGSRVTQHDLHCLPAAKGAPGCSRSPSGTCECVAYAGVDERGNSVIVCECAE